MPPEEWSDAASVPLKEDRDPGAGKRRTSYPRLRHLLHFHVLAAILSVFFGLEMPYFDPNAFAPIVQGLFISSFLFPPAVVLLWTMDHSREKWSWLAIPSSLLMSWLQLRALGLLAA
jgi:hypothetical protein